MPKLFISYRRGDTQMVAGRLRESLAGRLGERAIFRDKNSIAAGEDWTKAIADALSEGVVVLALIGPSWLTARDDSGRRRLDDPADWNRVELELAFERNSRVIPLLVDDARPPVESELPDGLKALARSQALKLRDDDWDSDVERLVRALGAHDVWLRMRRTALAVAALLAIILAGGIGYWWLPPNEPNGKPADNSGGSTYRSDILQKLIEEQRLALSLMHSDKPKAIRLIDDNLGGIAQALRSFPNDADLHALAGDAAKNVYASSKGVLPPDKRAEYLASAQWSFEQALKLDPNNATAVNGMRVVLFYGSGKQKLIEAQRQALSLMHSDKPKAIRLIDDNLGRIAQALRSFPNDADLHALAGYAAKNVYASSKGVLPPDKRAEYLARAQRSFEQALKLDPNDAGAVNGTGNVLFYEGRFDEAIRRFEEAIKLADGKYEDAAHDLNLARRVKAGEIAFDP